MREGVVMSVVAWVVMAVWCTSVTTAMELPTAGVSRRAKMPNFSDSRVVQDYSRRTPFSKTNRVSSVSSSGFRLPASVNLLKVKTNSTYPHKNERNVTLHLNIPASVSGFLLEEIDLKYVKKSRKKSKSNKMSNLLIKYFTNRSSNLHLSSVTKQNEIMPDYYPRDDLKERRDDEYPFQKGDSVKTDDSAFERPFRYKHKYPLALLEKIRSSSNARNKQRGAKLLDAGGDQLNNFQEPEDEDDTNRPRRSSKEDDVEDDGIEQEEFDALESILTSKTVIRPPPIVPGSPEVIHTGTKIEASIEELHDMFEHAIDEEVSEVEDVVSTTTQIPYEQLLKKVVEPEATTEMNNKVVEPNFEATTETIKRINEPSSETTTEITEKLIEKTTESTKNDDDIMKRDIKRWTFPHYLLSIMPSLKSSVFGRSGLFKRNKRSLDDYLHKPIINNKKAEQFRKKSHSIVAKRYDTQNINSPFAPAVTFSDPRLTVKKQIHTDWGNHEADEGNRQAFQSRPSDLPSQHQPQNQQYQHHQQQPHQQQHQQQPQQYQHHQVHQQQHQQALPQHQQHLNHQQHLESSNNEAVKSGTPGVAAEAAKRLTKLDHYFTVLRLPEEDCRQRILCEVAGEEIAYAPLADMFRKQTTVDGDAENVRRLLLESSEGARLLSYMEAASRGRNSVRDCNVYRCPVSADEVLDRGALSLWREVADWLTVKVGAANGRRR